MRLAWIAAAARGSSPPIKSEPPAPSPPDAAVVAAPPDVGVPEAVTNAPAWVFRFRTADRDETWTLRHAGGNALLVVDSAQRSLRYVGLATGSDNVALDVKAGTAKMTLDCKREKLSVSAKCNDTKAKPIEVLNCYHRDFKAPMPFGPAPGIEYVVETSCNGYRLIAP
jgi:hypothetical protein